MPEIDPVIGAIAICGIYLSLGLIAAWVGRIGATRFDNWRKRRTARRRINRAIDNMNCGAPEGGRKHRPF